MVIIVSLIVAVMVFLAVRWFADGVLARKQILGRIRKTETRSVKEPDWFQPIASMRDASGVDMSFTRWLLLSVGGFVLGMGIGTFFLKNPMVGVLLGLTFMVCPTWFLNYKAVKYREKVAEGLVPAFETFYSEYSLSRNMAKALDMTARQVPEPACSEFERMSKEVYSGYSIEEVLYGFVRRMNNRWVRLFTSLLILHEKKGAEIREPILNLISEQKKRQMEVKKERTEMAQVRTVHMVLMVASIVLFLFNLITKPDSYTFFTTDSQGRILLLVIVAMLLSSLVIFLWMNRKEVD
jgi:tight adherence protein B